MANTCFGSYIITGELNELETLCAIMQNPEYEYPKEWVGHIVEALNDGVIPDELYVRGWTSEIILDKEKLTLSFNVESAWEPLVEAWDWIIDKFESLSVYFMAEEPGFEIYVKRENPIKGWFTDNYIVEINIKGDYLSTEYFVDKEDAFQYITNTEGVGIEIKTKSDIDRQNKVWSWDSDVAYIHFHEYEEV